MRKLSPAQGNFQRQPETFPATEEQSHSLLKGEGGDTLQPPLCILYPQLEFKLGRGCHGRHWTKRAPDNDQ